jgi:hypothetical protein
MRTTALARLQTAFEVLAPNAAELTDSELSMLRRPATRLSSDGHDD